ncbi:unnamed protein product [Ilex paraguariensis]|uniref:Uncharacterized protein n=1 Tax=Ilex paraguariensis TaxID=185542 RepID=A0ABC8RVC9_9AQUA
MGYLDAEPAVRIIHRNFLILPWHRRSSLPLMGTHRPCISYEVDEAEDCGETVVCQVFNSFPFPDYQAD